MGRRYLTIDEAMSALRRGKSVECFLGSCERNGAHGVRHASISLAGDEVELRVFDTADEGNLDSLDLYEFGPLDPALYPGDADEVQTFSALEMCIAALEQRWPALGARLVNEGVLQDEYRDYIAAGRRT